MEEQKEFESHRRVLFLFDFKKHLFSNLFHVNARQLVFRAHL